MTKAAIIPFFNYEQGNEQLLWKFFILHAKNWAKYVDKIYIIDSGCNLLTFEGLPNNLGIIKTPQQSHWQNMNEAIRLVPEELLLLLDSDMIIYEPLMVHFGFEQLEKGVYDVMAILDSSGGSPINSPQFAENDNRFERRRICPYFCFLRKSALRSDFDFTPRGGKNWTDSMGVITEQFIEDGKEIWELQDDRSTISLEDDGKITSTQWLDTPPKKWALKENPNLGYYHIRNFGGGLKILKDKDFGFVPGREARRLIAWVYALGEKTGEFIPAIDLRLFAKKVDDWAKYYGAFKKYHFWLEKI